MSKKGRAKNRERRRRAATPGADWTAAPAAERALAAKNEVVDRYPTNPLLHVIESATYRAAVDQRAAEVAQTIPDSARAIYPNINEIAHRLVTGTPSTSLPSLPRILEDRIRAWETLPTEIILSKDQRPALQAAHQFITTNAAGLSVAETFILSPAMHSAVVAAANTLDVEDYLTWSETDMPAEVGFVHLPYTQIVTPGQGRVPKDLRAISWRLCAVHRPEGNVVRGISVTGWLDADGPVQAPDFTEQRRESKRRGYPFPRLIRDFNTTVPLDQFDDKVDATIADQAKEVFSRPGLRESDNTTLGEHAGGDISDPVGDFEFRYLFAFMRLAEQRIATLASAPATHTNGRRSNSGVEDVRVVQLRSATHQGSDGTGDERTREYSHRWVVRMHKVRQWYPSEQRHRVIWRGPYIKGPDDAPLLAGEKVQALVR